MSTDIIVKVDLSGLKVWSTRTESIVRRAASKAGGDAIRAMRVEGSRRIRERKAMKVAAVNRELGLSFPSAKQQLIWSIRAKDSPMPVIAFKPRQTKKGVSVTITKGKRVLIRGAFIATMKSGHEGVFQRRGPKRTMTRGRYKGKMRQPIREAYTTRVSEAFGDAIPFMEKRGRSVFEATFNRVLPLEAAKAAR